MRSDNSIMQLTGRYAELHRWSLPYSIPEDFWMGSRVALHLSRWVSDQLFTSRSELATSSSSHARPWCWLCFNIHE